jgi:RHS repeat-associated protein
MDLDRKIVAIRYNSLNLPDTIQFMNGNQIIHKYDATGRKLRTEYVTAPNNIVVPIGATIDAQGSVFTRNGTIYNNNIEYRFGNSGYPELARLHHPEGYLEYNTPDDGFEGNIQELNHYSYYRRDHLGNIREVWSAPYQIAKDYGPVQTFGAYTSQRTQYYPSGLPWKSNTGDSPTTQPYKYNGKELVETHGLNAYDSQARWYYPDIMRTTTMDPLAEKYYSVSPYAYCSNNPINRIDPDGRADFWLNGRVIGNDGIDDQKIYNIKTTEKDFNGVAGAGLSKKGQKATVDFIKKNSGNAEAFQNNGIAYANSIGIESSADNRQAMVNEVGRDNGKGGTADANNREYGGSIENGKVVTVTPGAVANPKTDATVNILLPSGVSTFHSHPSGTVVNAPSEGTIGGTTTTYSFTQSPSPMDINAAGTNTHYVFGRSSGVVYVYTANGIQAVIPMKQFVTPKK